MKSSTKVSTKQKVMISIGVVVILLGGLGLLNALGNARGFGFLPKLRTNVKTGIIKTTPVKTNTIGKSIKKMPVPPVNLPIKK